LAATALVPGAGAASDQGDLGVTVGLCQRSAGQHSGFTAEPIMIGLLRVDAAGRAEVPRFDILIPHNAAADGSGRVFQSLVAERAGNHGSPPGAKPQFVTSSL
jgi:hypothetical protein